MGSFSKTLAIMRRLLIKDRTGKEINPAMLAIRRNFRGASLKVDDVRFLKKLSDLIREESQQWRSYWGGQR